MPDNQTPRSLPSGGFIQNTVDYFKLVLRLLADGRVSLWLKLIPLAAVGYMVSPLDAFIPYIDDAGIFGLAMYMFVEMSPPAVVAEHRRALQGKPAENTPEEPPKGDVIDGKFREDK